MSGLHGRLIDPARKERFGISWAPKIPSACNEAARDSQNPLRPSPALIAFSSRDRAQWTNEEKGFGDMLRKLFVLCLALMAGVAVASAASTVNITGKITDSSGAAIQNAAVTLTDMSTNRVTNTTTGADGTFVFHGVATGPQILNVEKSGFESYTEHISPAARQNLT